MMVHSCDYKHRAEQKNFGGGARTLSLRFVDVWNIPNVCLLLLEMRRASETIYRETKQCSYQNLPRSVRTRNLSGNHLLNPVRGGEARRSPE